MIFPFCGATDSGSAVSQTEAPTLFLPISKTLQSLSTTASAEIPFKEDLAANISLANSFNLSLAVLFNSRTIFLSASVVVGPVKFKVSERIPASKSFADVAGTFLPASLYNLAKSAEVLPIGSVLIAIGVSVTICTLW